MIIVIKNVLHENQLKVIRTLLANAEFVDGKLSAGSEAIKVKQNEELARQSPLHEQLNQMLMPALLQNPEYQAFAFPIKIATPFYARYTQGMSYGLHVDDPVMGPMNGRYRSDISTTIFLNDDYEGGDLVIMDTFGERRIKPTAGDAIVYPSTSLHEVTEVVSGERLVAVLWAQSMIKDPLKRDLVYELGQARNILIEERTDSLETGHVSNVYANLVRRWSDV